MKKFTLLMAFLFTLSLSYAQNLAIGKTAVGSSENQAAALAVDGNGVTRWESASEDPQWISIDLEQSTAIGRVVLNWEGAYGKVYDIQVSDDNTNWTTIYSESNSDGGIDDFTATGNGRYVRMYGTERATGWGYSLYEFEIYAPADAATDATLSDLTVNGTTIDGFRSNVFVYDIELPVGTTVVPAVTATPSQDAPAQAQVTDATSLPGTTSVLVMAKDGSTSETYTINFTVDKENVALNKTATASTENEAGNNAFDGNMGSRWESAHEDPQWISVDLAGVYDITGVDLYWEGAYGSAYTIDVSDDAINWITVYTETSGDGSRDEISFATTKGRYVRMHGTSRATVYGYSLYEFEVFGTLDESSEPTGIDHSEASAVSVYPNPVDDHVSIRSESVIDYIEVYNLTGKCVFKTKVGLNTGNVSVGSLKKGIYILKVFAEGQAKTLKLIKK